MGVAPLIEPRESCAAVEANGMIFVMGGISSASPSGAVECLASVERFSPRTGVWDPMPPMQYARGAVAAVAIDGLIYAVGGRDGTQSLDSAERFRPDAMCWESLPALRSARFGAAAAALGAFMYVLGGKGGGRVL